MLLFVPQNTTRPCEEASVQVARAISDCSEDNAAKLHDSRPSHTNRTQKVHVQRLRKYVPLPEHLLPTDDDSFSSSASSDEDSESERASGHAPRRCA